jgi:acetylornithine aminotransferase/acetylornithine/N-succinyldiaminopimelate aminotransferase
VPSYARLPVALVRGQGCTLWDAEGNQYLDLYGGHCTTLLGHGHPQWVAAIAAQAERLGFISNIAANDTRAEYLQRLCDFAPDHLEQAFLCNSGAEANETAVKMALKATGRSRVIAMHGGFHGRTAGALSLTHLGGYRNQFPEIVRDTVAVPFGDIEALSAALGGDTAAVILEPIQSMAGMHIAPEVYYRDLVAACHANGTLVVFDEVQTGMGRLGASFAATLFDARADLVTLAKGIGNGFPLAAVLATREVAATVTVGEQGTTFGGGPMACAAGLAVLDAIASQGLVAHAAAMELVARRLLVTGPVIAVRGRGLLLGLETRSPAQPIVQELLAHGILVGTAADPHVMRLMPPLIVTESELARLARALNAINGDEAQGERNE